MPRLTTTAAEAGTPPRPKFTAGSTMRHVAMMSTTGGVGLVAIFFVDALNLFYISLLGQKQLAAAVGFAGTVQFFTVSTAIGLAIGASAVVSRAVGAGETAAARRLAASSLVLVTVALAAVALLAWLARYAVLDLLGATGETREIAARFLSLSLPSLPVLGIGMLSSGLLRAVGDGRRAMLSTLASGGVAALADPLLILGLGLGVDGAAVALVVTRISYALAGLKMAVGVHDLIARPRLRAATGDARAILSIGAPAVATQLSTPFGNAFLTGVVATHGDAAVAGWAVVGRLTPLAFGVIFAVPGAVGPILGQNMGAGLWERIRTAYRDAMLFSGAWVLTAWALLWLATGPIVRGFGLDGAGRQVAEAFTAFGAGGFLFTGALFVSNAAFNNLGRPVLAALFNWSRDAGAIPLLALAGVGAAGAGGAILMQALAALAVGSVAAVAGWRHVSQLSRRAAVPAVAAAPQPAFASGRAALAVAMVPGERAEQAESPLEPRGKSR